MRSFFERSKIKVIKIVFSCHHPQANCDYCDYGWETKSICNQLDKYVEEYLRSNQGHLIITCLEWLVGDYSRLKGEKPEDLQIRLLFNLGCAYQQTKDQKEEHKNLKKALTVYEQVLKLDPHDHQTYFNLGTILKKLNKKNQARPHFRKIPKINLVGDTSYRHRRGYQPPERSIREVLRGIKGPIC